MPAPRPMAARALILAALLSIPAAGTPLEAQTRLRVEPDVVIFDGQSRTRRQTVSLWVDNIPSPGLGSFLLNIESRVRQLIGQTPCLIIEEGRLDPGLKAAWNNDFVSNFIPLPTLTSANWQAFARSQGGLPLPTGSIRLGEIVFQAREDRCPAPLQDEFFLTEDLAFWGSGPVPQTPYDEIRGAAWAWGAIPDIDFTVTCPRALPPPPGPFVDGDLLLLECQVSNLGLLRAPQGPILEVVFSADETVDDDDPLIARSVATGLIAGNSTVSFDIATRPVRTVPGTVNICSRIDVVDFGQDQGWGVMLERDETNNVECQPLPVIEPRRDLLVPQGSLSLAPDPRDPAGMMRAGLNFQVDYQERNQGIAAVRQVHENRVLLGRNPSTFLTDPNAELCAVTIDGPAGLPLLGGTSLGLRYGLGTGTSSRICKIPFRFPPGNHDLHVQVDSGGNVQEQDPNGDPGPAEGNNLLSIPVTVAAPLDPQFRVQHRGGTPTDQRVEIFGPSPGSFVVAVASASGLTSYRLQLSWSPPELLSLGDPARPAGDPNQISFRPFLESMGLSQSCAVTGIDPAAGTTDVECTTSDPGGTGAAAWTEKSVPLMDVTVTPVLPGQGTFSISDISAGDALGQPFAAPRSSGGTFVINGSPDVAVINPVPAPAAWPGEAFTVRFDLVNDGFGTRVPPLQTDLIVSRDAFHDPASGSSPDMLACTLNESSALPGKTTVSRQLDTCLIDENILPGLYTGFYQIRNEFDTGRRATAIIPFPSRVLSLRKSPNGRKLELRPHPVAPGGSAGGALTSSRHLPAGSVASVGSEARRLNWFVRLHRPRSGPGKLFVQEIPVEDRQKNEILRELRVSRKVRKVLGGIDIDGDGEDELMLLHRARRTGDRLDFRRMDFQLEFPSVCPSAAFTPEIQERVVAATGIQADGDAEDELAVVSRDGALTLYDIVLTGPVLPAGPCIFKGTPSTIQPHGTAGLVPLASDTGFSVKGDRLQSLCTLDLQLDGTEEIGGLFKTGKRRQAFRIFEPPAAPGGSALLLADDEGFGGTGGHGRIVAVGCTR